MGADLYLNPPPESPAKPLWEQVKALSDRRDKLKQEVVDLRNHVRDRDIRIAELEQALKTMKQI